MSGTDYTQTPNYGLYKPIPNADISQWGSHLNLNADTLDGLMHGFLPLAGGVPLTGPLIYTATGGTTPRAAQDRAADHRSALDFGCICDGVTDDGAALNAAIAAMPAGCTMFVPGSIYTTQTITVANGRRLEMPPSNSFRPTGGPTLMTVSYAIIGTASLSPVVLVAGGEGGLTNVCITRNGTPAAHSIGLQCLGQDHIYTNVRSYNHARCIQVGASQAAPVSGYSFAITTRFDHCMTWSGFEDSVYLINAPETTFYDHRFGIVGSTDPTAATSLVCIDGDNNNSSASATNSASFFRCQFNPAAVTPHLYTIRCTAWNYGIMKLVGCYSGGATTAFIYVDAASTVANDINLIGNTISPMASTETLISDPGHKIKGLTMIGNHIDGGASPNLFLSGVSAQIIGNAFGGPFVVQLDSMTGGVCIGNIANTINYTGTYTGPFTAAHNTATNITQSATGSINYIETYGNYGSQLTLGKLGQAGRADFRRASDGALTGWIGINSALGNNPLTINQGGGSAAINFEIGGVEMARVDANGLGLSKVTAVAAAPGAAFGKLALIPGTNTGTAKLVAYAGTSSTPVTIMDNIGAGF